MNQHTPPPRRDMPEPPWVQEVRDMVGTINRQSAMIHVQVARYIRWVKWGVAVVLGAQAFGLLLNWAVTMWLTR